MPEIKEGWARWLTETERETLRSWATGTRVWKLARTLAASRALVRENQKALGHATHLTEHNKGMCVRCREAREKIAIALALTEADMLQRLEVK